MSGLTESVAPRILANLLQEGLVSFWTSEAYASLISDERVMSVLGLLAELLVSVLDPSLFSREHVRVLLTSLLSDEPSVLKGVLHDRREIEEILTNLSGLDKSPVLSSVQADAKAASKSKPRMPKTASSPSPCKCAT